MYLVTIYVYGTHIFIGVVLCACGALKIAASNLNVINNPFSFTNNNYLSVWYLHLCECARVSKRRADKTHGGFAHFAL